MKYSVRELAELTNSQFAGDAELVIENIAIDSRSIFSSEKTAFIAIRTARNSGEKFITDAVSKGIKVIISESLEIDNQDITWIKCNDAISFLRRLAIAHLNNFSRMTKIGITGSNGKTVVKEWLYQCLLPEFRTVKSPKSYNSQIGLPLSILLADAQHQLGIFEVGISQPGEMELQEEVLQPEIGVLTNVGFAHSSHFQSFEQHVEEKIKLFQNSKVIFYNGDDSRITAAVRGKFGRKKIISFGLSPQNDIYPIKAADETICIVINNFKVKLSLPICYKDDQFLCNVLIIAGILNYFNFSPEKISQKISQLRPIEMRMESVKGIRRNLIINDSYTLDRDSLSVAFQSLQEYQNENKILIISDFAEVQSPEKFYPEIVKLINAQSFSRIILVGEEFPKYQHGLIADSHSFPDTQALLQSGILTLISHSLILVKGARKFRMEDISKFLQLQKHDTVLEINLNSLLHNINRHRDFLRQETRLMAMVKANAYGVGSFEISEFLQHHHIDYLGVAFADEGAELRKKGITVPIMVMNPEQHSYGTVIDFGLEPEIYSFRVLELFSKALAEKGIQEAFPVHIKLETGMNRLGFEEKELMELAALLKTKNVVVKSIFSHFATADMPEESGFVHFQAKNFERMSAKLSEELGYRPMRHICNSAGISLFPEYQYDMARLGIGMYGISANRLLQNELQPVAAFKTVISQISVLKPGETVGYGRRYSAAKETRIATIPVGYADGIRRSLSGGKGSVSVGGKLCPIVGSVCMDMLMIDLGDAAAGEGDEVIIFHNEPSLQDFANYCDTIPYEVLTSISSRVKRIYIKD
ncbi:UDP-N-acetylmuramoyl-tripeptide--D-alanyl-D-alanine ligase [Cruoricaptor ignavus]|uniref:Alanine racemase n=1 Tax=Cruoricaptor ignavus TaxID=1118202 RepID=A0A1M6FQ52_9FLAO|nr:bifunctional UDP-N-acetylmuramoyl-tripeptide:D-alanyl-D-alanine ligase/alanine racemase [Cruoricaptor ignavus]SHI99800.1 UDP-N-acetylmuramoyl-tripeptide--D-alanyl-D-alanine ligase [Cruoricaptor ignavus]